MINETHLCQRAGLATPISAGQRRTPFSVPLIRDVNIATVQSGQADAELRLISFQHSSEAKMTSKEPETTQELVYRLYIKEALPFSTIEKQLEGRASHYTVRDYITKSIKLAKERGDEVPMRKKAARKGGYAAGHEVKARSQLHVIIGNRLARHRETVEHLKPTEFVAAHGYFASVVVLRQMEQGLHNFTLTELQLIAGLLSLPLKDLIGGAPC